MKFPSSPRRHPGGWTLLELLIVAIIIAILVTLSMPLYSYLRMKAQFVACVSNLRVLHGGFMGHMMDNNMVWPQMPESIFTSPDEERVWKWWYETLKPYNIAKKAWACPADVHSPEELYSGEDHFVGTYNPTLFDEAPNSAFLWANQPWLIERGQLHGKKDGPNILMMDGTVRQAPSLFGQQQ